MASNTIAEALESLRGKIAAAYTACEEKGAALPATQDAAHLAQAVQDIPSGGDDSATILDFGNGDLSSFNWKGEITYHNIVDAGLFDEVEQTWTKMPVNVTIGSGVTSIGTEAFAYCSGLMSITIPNSVTSIGGYSFNGCTNLAGVTIPDSVTSIGIGVFYDCSSLTSITIPNSVMSIGGDAFCKCSGLTSITIPNSVMSIGNRAFYGCSRLTSIMIPDSVTSIGGYAFSGCSGLTSVTIGNSVTSIGEKAFKLEQSIPILYIVIPTKTIAQVQAMDNYSNWSLIAGYKICCSDGVIEIT